MKVCAIIPSAGSGKRLRSRIDKPLIRLFGKEIIWYVLKRLEESFLISDVIITARPKSIAKIRNIVAKNNFSKVREIVRGGKERCDSVLNALFRVEENIDFVLVHDVARPFITADLIKRTLLSAKRYGASVAAVPVKPTIKLANQRRGSFICKTVNRSFLWEAQTPQAFKKDLLIKAYRLAGNKIKVFTDDASLVERMNKPVKLVIGSYSNIKITTPEDLVIAKALLKAQNQKTVYS